MKKILLFFTLLATISSGQAQNLLSFADSLRGPHKIPEMAFAVLGPDTLYTQGVVGFHKINDSSERAKAEDYFYLGSNSKAMTAFVAAYLVRQGAIQWNTRYTELFPKEKKKIRKGYRDVELQDFLSHRAKVPAFTAGQKFQELPLFEGNKQEKRAAFARHVLTLKPMSEEKEFLYSNAGYSIAALMLEKASGKSWEELIREIIGEKLGLELFFGWPNRNGEDQPWGHFLGNPLSPDTDYDMAMIEPASNLSMNLSNYARFVQLNLKGLAGQDGFLSSETIEFLHNGRKEYAMGWGNIEIDGKKYSVHAGSDGTFYCYTKIDRALNKAYILMINNGEPDAQEGLKLMLGKLEELYGK